MRRSRATVRRVPTDTSKPLRFWQAAVELERGKDGSRRRRTIRDKDHDECQRKLALAIVEEASPLRRPRQPKLPPMPTLLPSGSTGEWVVYWLEGIAKHDLAPKSVATYRSAVRLHIVPAIGSVPLLELSAAHARTLAESVRAKGLAGATALHAHRVLSAALAQAHREGYVHRNVALLTKPPRKGHTQLAVLSPANARRIILDTQSDRLGSRYAAALLTGARQGELLGLELDRVGDNLDLSWQLQRLTWMHGCRPHCGWKRGTDCPDRVVEAPLDHERRPLTGGLWLVRPKSAAGWRTIPLVGPLRNMVEGRVAAARREHNPHGLLWTMDAGRRQQDTQGRPIDPSVDSRAWHRLLGSLAVPQVRLHDARHATIDLLYEAGVSEIVIKDLAGHARVDMSRRYRNGRAVLPMADALTALGQFMNLDHHNCGEE
jgi:integrase